jgi:hypothetical protein
LIAPLVAETVRAEMLNGRVVDPTALVRLEGEARRAVRALGLKIEKPKARFSPLRHRQKAEAKAAAAAAGVMIGDLRLERFVCERDSQTDCEASP